MGIDMSNGYDDLRKHIGHQIACVCYGADSQDPHNIAIECETCHEVIIDFNHPDVDAYEPPDAIAALIKIPTCWKKLVDTEFEDISKMTSEKQCKGIADPEPHYDDFRSIRGTFGNKDYEVFLSLCSGQSNYFGGVEIFHKGSVVYELGPMDNFEDLTGNLPDGTPFCIKIEEV